MSIGRRWFFTSLGAITIFGFSWLARAISITRNYDIFIDEVTYTRIAENLATGHGLMLYGTPFDLHPPAAFALYALAIKIFSLHGSIVNILLGLRPFVAAIGSGTCTVAFILVKRLSNWRIGAIVAIIAALDPFEIFFDSRVMLEAPAQLGSTLAILFLAMSLRAQSERRSWSLVLLSGIAAGFAMCAKENFGLVLALTFLFSWATGWVTSRRKAAIALLLMSCCYLFSECVVIASTGFQSWWYQSTSGLQRLIGDEQISGFNSTTVHVSLVSRLTANATHFSITYLILGFGAVTGGLHVIAVLRRHASWSASAQPVDRGRLLVAIWAVSAAAYLGYATVFGTLEEQMYYLLFIPSLCALIILASHITPRLATHWRAIAVVLVAAMVLTDSAVWMAVHKRSDDEYRQLLAWVPGHVPAGSTVAVTDYTAQFLLKGVVLGKWATVPALIEHHVDYVLLSTTLVTQGYGLGTFEFEQYLRTHATVAFEATGPSDGALILYNVRAITGARK